MKTILIMMFMFCVCFANAQNVIFGSGAPSASSMLEVKASNKGILIPRVSLTSLTDVAAVPSPAVSLMVYNTNTALKYGAGYYSWSGNRWQKMLTNVAAGGDLSGNYPNPAVKKLNGVVLPTATLTQFDNGKIFRYNSSTKEFDLGNPIESYETIVPGFITITGVGGQPPKMEKSSDGANLLPLCYGIYDPSTNTLSGNTSNVSVAKVNTGIFRITITPASIPGNFTPAYAVSGLDYGITTCYRESNNTLVVDTWTGANELNDHSFQFVVFNR